MKSPPYITDAASQPAYFFNRIDLGVILNHIRTKVTARLRSMRLNDAPVAPFGLIELRSVDMFRFRLDTRRMAVRFIWDIWNNHCVDHAMVGLDGYRDGFQLAGHDYAF